ncbi:ATP phosphoribosyltransferase regulatory subunit [Candidatus Gracilibacteria bacterium]|nr:ATP phosphoribosyltransferase regulatory subunit [Candidatus Gracilibacteria bacterium]
MEDTGVNELEENIIEEGDSVSLKDIFPEDHKYLTFLKKVFRHEFRKGGFRRISIPIITSTDLYSRSGQEQFNEHTVLENYALKFDTSLSILDSYLRTDKKEEIQPVYYYYIDNLFEKDGDNLTQIYNIGGDIIGEKDPILDMECIFLLDRVFKAIGIEGKYSIRVNSVGLKKEQGKYCEALVDFYADKKHLLSEVSLKNLEENPMLLLNPQNEDEEILLGQAPIMRKFLKKHSKLHLEKFEEFMEMVGLEYEYDNTFLGSRPYYTNTVWEMVENETGEVLAHGGRYDTLSMDIDDELRKEVPATGFDTNVERLINLLKKSGISIRNKDQLDLFFVQLGDDAKKQVFPIAAEARKAGINTMTSLGTPSMKEQMLKAQRSNAEFVVIVGIMEARNGNWQLRNMKKGTQDEIKKDDIIDFVVSQIGKENLDFYSPIRDLTIGEPIVEQEGEEEGHM